MKFIKPTDEAIKRMTVRSLTSLIESLKTQRAQAVKPHDEQIKFFEELLWKKKSEENANAKTAGTV